MRAGYAVPLGACMTACLRVRAEGARVRYMPGRQGCPDRGAAGIAAMRQIKDFLALDVHTDVCYIFTRLKDAATRQPNKKGPSI